MQIGELKARSPTVALQFDAPMELSSLRVLERKSHQKVSGGLSCSRVCASLSAKDATHDPTEDRSQRL